MTHSNKTGGLLQTAEEELREIQEELKELRSLESRSLESEYRKGFLEGCGIELTRGLDEHPKFWNEGLHVSFLRIVWIGV